jgi:DNA polymerase I-like protein with 3'-5' exonuclease and polymerase domains
MTVVHYGVFPHPDLMWECLLEVPNNHIGVDVETYSIDDITLLGVGLGLHSDGFYVTPDDPSFYRIIDLLQDTSKSKVYHNAPFDLRVLREYDVDVDNVDDTALMARLYPEPSAVLEDVSFWVGQQTQSMKRLFTEHQVSKVIDLPFEVLAEKCCRDAMATRALYDYYAGLIDMDYYTWLRPMIGILNKISRQGILLDQARLEELDQFYSKKVMYTRQLCTGMGFSPSSPQQVGHFLGGRGNFLPLTRKGGQLITDDEHLRKLQDPVAHLVLECRHASKMESTYIRPFKGQPRAYTTLRMEASTGRVNSTGAGKNQPDRNLQNIPKNAELAREAAPTIRSAFIPDNGLFTKMDQSQVELRVTADMSNDANMKALFSHDEDMHQWVVDRTGLTRTLAKNLTYGVYYGGDVETVANFLGMADLHQVQELLDMYKDLFPDAWAWLFHLEELGMAQGYVQTRRGRKLRLPSVQGEKHMRNCARNYPIQGTALEVIAEVMMDPAILQHLDITRLQLHDELIFDGDIHIEDMEYNPAKSNKEGHPTYDVKGRLAWLSGFYTPLEVTKVERWG